MIPRQAVYRAEQPVRRDALAGAYVRGAFPTGGALGVTFRLREGLRLVNLRGQPSLAANAENDRMAAVVDLPRLPNSAAEFAEGVVLWLGPDEWLVVTGERDQEALARWRGVATEVSHGRTVVRIGGPSGQDLLATGIGLDLHQNSFKPGACVQTQYGRVAVILHHLRHGGEFDLYVARSYARHLWELLSESAREFGYRVL